MALQWTNRTFYGTPVDQYCVIEKYVRYVRKVHNFLANKMFLLIVQIATKNSQSYIGLHHTQLRLLLHRERQVGSALFNCARCAAAGRCHN